MSRIGKIARLSGYRREKLNLRIENGEPGKELVKWLNSLEDVQEVLENYFEERPITEQNLSEWTQGGFLDWQRHQERRALIRDFLAEAEELEEEIGEIPLTDRLTGSLSLALAQLLQQAMSGEPGPQRLKIILEISRELTRLRKGDHQMQKLHREREALEKAEAKARKLELQRAKNEIAMTGRILRREFCDGIESGTLAPERAEEIRKFFFSWSDWLAEGGVKDLSAPNAQFSAHPDKSDKTQPNPSKSRKNQRFGSP